MEAWGIEKSKKMVSDELKSHFANLYNMVMADDKVKPEELAQLYAIGKRHGISEDEFNKILLSPIDFVKPNTLDKKVEYLYNLAEIIYADHDVDENEVATLKRYCVKFGFEPENSDEIADFLIESVKSGDSLQDVFNKINS